MVMMVVFFNLLDLFLFVGMLMLVVVMVVFMCHIVFRKMTASNVMNYGMNFMAHLLLNNHWFVVMVDVFHDSMNMLMVFLFDRHVDLDLLTVRFTEIILHSFKNTSLGFTPQPYPAATDNIPIKSNKN